MINRDLDFVRAYERYELDLEEFIDKFREIIYEEPKQLPIILDAYRRLADEILEDIDPSERHKFALEIIARYCVLADYDFDESLIFSSLENKDGFFYLAPYFDNPERYGRAMAALSTHLGLEGESLGEYVSGDYTLH